jgi:T5SS/PEP-CTERM-associated repeat protein
MTAGTITFANEFYVGIDDNGRARRSTGTANISGGTITQTTQTGGGAGMFLGRSGGLGVMNLTGTDPITISGINESNIGRGGVGSGGFQSEGTLTISNAATNITVNNGLFAGREGGKGTVSQAGGTINAGELYIGNGAGSVGHVNVTVGTFINHGSLEIGTGGGSDGTLTISGPAASYVHSEVSSNVQVGYSGGTGQVRVLNGGQFVTNWWLNVARSPGSVGIIEVDGAGSVMTVGAGGNDARVNIGEDGTGTMTVSNGGRFNSLASEMVVARNGGSIGTLNVTSGGQVKALYLVIGGGTASVNFNDGILIAAQNEDDFLRNFNAGNSEILAGGLTLDSNNFTY